MPFHAFDVSLELIRCLRDPVRQLRAADPKLADQLRRAAASVALNLAEGRRRFGHDRRYLFSVAAGSAAEVRAALQVAAAWGDVDANEQALQLVDRVVAMTWRLTH